MTHGYSCFVTGTDTGIGKTLIASAIVHGLARQGVRVAGMKPVAAGAEWRDGAWHNEDSDALAAVANVALPPDLLTPYLLRTPAAPHIAAALEGVGINPLHLLDCFRQVRQRCEAVVVEGVGGFRVPLTDDFDTADLAQQMALPVILVVGLRLGCISQALLAAEAIAARGLPLVGWVANRMGPEMEFESDNVIALSRRLHAPLLGCVPHLAQPGAAAAAAAACIDLTRVAGWCAPVGACAPASST